jgi:hypothetical protein
VVANPRNTPGRGYLVYKHLVPVLPKLSFGPTIAAVATHAFAIWQFCLSRTALLQPAKAVLRSRVGKKSYFFGLFAIICRENIFVEEFGK